MEDNRGVTMLCLPLPGSHRLTSRSGHHGLMGLVSASARYCTVLIRSALNSDAYCSGSQSKYCTSCTSTYQFLLLERKKGEKIQEHPLRVPMHIFREFDGGRQMEAT